MRFLSVVHEDQCVAPGAVYGVGRRVGSGKGSILDEYGCRKSSRLGFSAKDPLNSAFLDGSRAAPHPRRLLPCQSPTAHSEHSLRTYSQRHTCGVKRFSDGGEHETAGGGRDSGAPAAAEGLDRRERGGLRGVARAVGVARVEILYQRVHVRGEHAAAAAAAAAPRGRVGGVLLGPKAGARRRRRCG